MENEKSILHLCEWIETVLQELGEINEELREIAFAAGEGKAANATPAPTE